jgi:hypothetical protein
VTTLGRNEQCHCGSGKKYKRCHLDADRARARIDTALAERVLHDLPTMRMAVAEAKPGFSAEVMAVADELNETFREEIGDGLEGENAANALIGYMERVEAAMTDIASTHSRGYWMHMTRRLPPTPLGTASDWTVRLYKRVLTLAAIKHGQPTANRGEFETHKSPMGDYQVPTRLDHTEIVDAFALQYLAFELTTANQAYRRVGKGAKLAVADDDFHAVAEGELEELIQDLDRRVREYGSLTGIYGAAADKDFPTELPRDGEAPLAVLAVVPNTEQLPPEKALISKDVKVPGPTNFIGAPMVIDGYYEALSSLADDVEKSTGVAPRLLTSVVWALAMYLIESIKVNPATEVQVMKTGYLMSVRDDGWEKLTREVAYFAGPMIEHLGGARPDQAEALQLTRLGLDALTWTEDAIASISLVDRLPFKLVIDAGDRLMVDYTALPEMFADLFRQIGFLGGESGNIKAANFEAAAASRARAAGYEPWKESTEIHHQDGAKREIDVGLIGGDTLYVVECKAYAQNPKIDRGDWAARLNRQGQLVKYFEQAKTLAGFIDAERTGRDYDVPAEVSRIEPILCTPGVEFIWSRDPDLWVTDVIPRICTVDELVALLEASE